MRVHLSSRLWPTQLADAVAATASALPTWDAVAQAAATMAAPADPANAVGWTPADVFAWAPVLASLDDGDRGRAVGLAPANARPASLNASPVWRGLADLYTRLTATELTPTEPTVAPSSLPTALLVRRMLVASNVSPVADTVWYASRRHSLMPGGSDARLILHTPHPAPCRQGERHGRGGAGGAPNRQRPSGGTPPCTRPRPALGAAGSGLQSGQAVGGAAARTWSGMSRRRDQ